MGKMTMLSQRRRTLNFRCDEKCLPVSAVKMAIEPRLPA